MTTLHTSRESFLEKLYDLNELGKIDWSCDRNNSVISGKIENNTISISETSGPMGFKSYHVEITDGNGSILDKFTPDKEIQFIKNLDTSDEDDNLFGQESHDTDVNVRKIYQKAMSLFFKENLRNLTEFMNEI